jgi:hypothetical protein
VESYIVRVYEEGRTVAVWPQDDPYIAEYLIRARNARSAEIRAELAASRRFGTPLVAACAEQL